MKKQALSFKCALKGILNTIKSEAHMRFHIVAGFYVVVFSLFYNFSVSQWAILLLLIGSVMTAEVINTCVEHLCNLACDYYEPMVKFIKDAAAGAVLILAVVSAIVACMFFINLKVIGNIFNFFSGNIILLILLLLSVVISTIFVRFGPVGIKLAVVHINYKIKNKK